LRLRLVSAAALLAATLPGTSAASQTTAGAPPIAPCALGRSAFGLSPYYAAQVSAATTRYATTLGADTPATRQAATRSFAAAAAAYVYGMPQEILRLTVKGYVRNEIVNVNALATPSTQGVVSPNVDTAYSVAWIDLTDGPLVVNVPDTGGRFYTFQFMDAYTNAFAYVGTGSTGTHAGAYAVVGPGYSGSLPAGVTAIHSPTNTGWLLGRTLVNGAADFPAVKQIQQQYTLTPLTAWESGVRQPPVTIGSYPSGKTKTLPAGTAFIAALNQDLTIDPPPAEDDCALGALAPAGVVLAHPTPAQSAAADLSDIAGVTPAGNDDATTTAAVDAGVAAGARIVTAAAGRLEAIAGVGNHGWAILNRSIGTYGTDFLSRAVIGTDYLGANTPAQGLYPVAYVDGAGHALDGSSAYTITFPRGLLPPAHAFWSLTMYGSDNYLYANAIDRYAIGDRTPGLVHGRDGSLTLHIQHAAPAAGTAARANWLPAPSGAFHVILRLYQPDRAALDEEWRPPPILRAGETLRPVLTRLRIRAAGRVRVSYRDSQPAMTRVTIVDRRTGRVVARLRHHDRLGGNVVTLRLRPGRYRLRAQATGPLSAYDNAPSAAVSRNFRRR
jgi:hypothetical protein